MSTNPNKRRHYMLLIPAIVGLIIGIASYLN